MSAAWVTRPARCGHRRCAAAGRAAAAAGTCALGTGAWLYAVPSAASAAAFAGSVLVLATAIAFSGCWYRDDAGPGSLDEILADPPLPKRWTRADWAELEKELSR